jgi:hypothetical protein
MAQNAGQRPRTASAMREALREAARQGHSIARETNAQPTPSTNLYEQETQLIYAAASPATETPDAANKTGAIKADEATHAGSATSTGGASSSSTNVNDPDSVVTEVASVQPAAQKSRQRRRIIGLAASAAVLVALAAGVYTFTRNSAQTPPSTANVESTPAAPQTSNMENQNGQQPGETVIVIKKGGAETSNTAAPITRHTNVPPVKPVRENPQPVPPPADEDMEVDDSPPDPPNPNPKIRRIHPGDPGFEEAIRLAQEQRRAGEEAKRAAQEQRRQMLLKQRLILEQERRRREQMRRQP